jgi:hypothetical protein
MIVFSETSVGTWNGRVVSQQNFIIRVGPITKTWSGLGVRWQTSGPSSRGSASYPGAAASSGSMNPR